MTVGDSARGFLGERLNVKLSNVISCVKEREEEATRETNGVFFLYWLFKALIRLILHVCTCIYIHVCVDIILK